MKRERQPRKFSEKLQKALTEGGSKLPGLLVIGEPSEKLENLLEECNKTFEKSLEIDNSFVSHFKTLLSKLDENKDTDKFVKIKNIIKKIIDNSDLRKILYNKLINKEDTTVEERSLERGDLSLNEEIKELLNME